MERRARKLAEQEAKRAELARKAPFLGRWLWILFWMVIPSTVASLLAMDAMAGWAPGVYLFGKYLVLAALIGQVVVGILALVYLYQTADIFRNYQ